MKVVAIIQARMGSSRLPGKMLADIGGKPAVQWVIERVLMSQQVNEVYLATTVNAADDLLAQWAGANGVKCFRGSETDVLDRYYQTAKLAAADMIVRITGDCPLVDYQIVDQVIRCFVAAQKKVEYVSNVHPPTFPDGFDVEVFSFSALERAWQEASLVSEREHVTPYIWKHAELFPHLNVVSESDLSSYRITLDTPEDLIFIRKVAEECQRRFEYCGLKEIITIIEAEPKWKKINQAQERNEGYKKSIQED